MEDRRHDFLIRLFFPALCSVAMRSRAKIQPQIWINLYEQ